MSTNDSPRIKSSDIPRPCIYCGRMITWARVKQEGLPYERSVPMENGETHRCEEYARLKSLEREEQGKRAAATRAKNRAKRARGEDPDAEPEPWNGLKARDRLAMLSVYLRAHPNATRAEAVAYLASLREADFGSPPTADHR